MADDDDAQPTNDDDPRARIRALLSQHRGEHTAPKFIDAFGNDYCEEAPVKSRANKASASLGRLFSTHERDPQSGGGDPEHVADVLGHALEALTDATSSDESEGK